MLSHRYPPPSPQQLSPRAHKSFNMLEKVRINNIFFLILVRINSLIFLLKKVRKSQEFSFPKICTNPVRGIGDGREYEMKYNLDL